MPYNFKKKFRFICCTNTYSYDVEQLEMPIEPAPPYRMSSPSGSSVSSEESFDGDGLRDPYFVTLHFVTDPGQSSSLKHTIQPLTERYDPSFKLFNIAERSRPNGISNSMDKCLPALAVVLFMQYTEDLDDNRIVQAQSYLAGSPWKLHHSSDISGKHVLCEPNFQNFYTTETEMPLWAVRQVHYGNEHLRFMVYSSAEGWEDMIRFYSLLLGRNVDYQRQDFCYFLVHSRNNVDIQLAIKKVPREYTVRPLNSAFLQFKVREAGELVPLLPHACSPISPQRWQTTDPDGNVILLLVSRKGNVNSGHTTRKASFDALQSIIAPRAMKPKMTRTLNKIQDAKEDI
ncbi:protein FAM124A-like isoform X3 [Apostichopus japonicus]|uniref:protein FAM124A-like isoform X3 n=1 Tax=Stichopus japonicus TaxID=307972 RepID=UPI003AB45911